MYIGRQSYTYRDTHKLEEVIIMIIEMILKL